MALSVIDRFWHQWLQQPYRLAAPVDQGGGQPVVLLHGIGSSTQVWQNLLVRLSPLGIRIVAIDLLGFGASPKPDWPDYDIDDHARPVIAALKRLKSDQPVVLVGHSMGCLVAVRVARLHPELVKHLVLYEMPLYDGLPQKRLYRLRLNLYFRFYQRIMDYEPTFNPETAKLLERITNRVAGFEVTPETWQPFVKSLKHTIMHQTAAEDIKLIGAPMDVIYGSLDMLVIRGKPQYIFGEDNDRVTAHTIRERHVISPKAADFLTQRITAALDANYQTAPDG